MVATDFLYIDCVQAFVTRIGTFLRPIYAQAAAALQSHIRVGNNIYTEDWDALIILDACRLDALREVKSEYSFLGSIDTRWSLGSTSKEWLENTFVEAHRDEIESTAYITANAYAQELEKSDMNRFAYPMAENNTICKSFFNFFIRKDVVRASDFAQYYTLFDKELGQQGTQLHPSSVTDAAISVARDSSYDRYIIHYMQPHHPYLRGEETQWHSKPFEYLNNGGDFEKVWEAYLDNLRLVLDQVEILVENLDAERTVITADHGELFGEWGLTGHGVGIPHPDLRVVPWAETTALDRETHIPDQQFEETVDSDKINARLEALGYR